MLKLEWNAENDKHITARHGVTREQVEQALNGDTLQRGTVLRNGELRLRMVGEAMDGKVLFLVIASVRPGVVRAVTAFPAKRKLRKLYDIYRGRI